MSLLDDFDIDSIAKAIARGISGVGVSPNESDRNGEPANVVDGLFAIARAIHHLARAVDRHGGFVQEPDE